MRNWTLKAIVALTVVVWGATVNGVRAADRDATDRPNFIVVFIDDMGYADIGPFGSTANRTPNLDRMAAEGMRLTSFYAAPVCTPSRAALMTGCYPKRVGLMHGSWHGVLMPGDEHGLNPDEVTVAEALKARGYATAAVGKWHLGDQPPFLPTRHGFDTYFGIPYSNDMIPPNTGKKRNFPPLPLVRDETVIRELEDQNPITGLLTVEALKFIRNNADRPFFLYMPHAMVHHPLHAGDAFRDKSENGILGDAIEEIDWSVGQILNALKELGIDDNTLVLFTSDNGPAAGIATPLRGKKGSTFEGGMREPCVVRWPGTIPAGSSFDGITSTMDLLPTFASLAGGAAPEDRIIDGHDISDILTGKGAESKYEKFFYYSRGNLMGVRSGDWKLHLKGDRNKPALYNLVDDISEKTNVLSAHPGVVKRLRGYLDEARADLGDGLEHPGANTRPVGFYANPKPLLPPANGQPVGRGNLKIDPRAWSAKRRVDDNGE
ncbi:MAG: sulfatase family protein [Planctomycetota bacterium]|jgi:arylsulfatase A-like enzyme